LRGPKVCGCYFVTFLCWATLVDWCVVGEGQRTNTIKTNVLRAIGLSCLQIVMTTPHSIATETQLGGRMQLVEEST
jgi:hypothetical protein